MLAVFKITGRREDGKNLVSGKTTQAVLDSRSMKVDQQPNLEPTEPEIGDDLRLVHGEQAFNGFDLDQDFGVHDQVESIPMLQFEPLVTDASTFCRSHARPSSLNS